MNQINEMIQEFKETHNQIVHSLNEAEKSHAETLAAFITELEKRKSIILGVEAAICDLQKKL